MLGVFTILQITEWGWVDTHTLALSAVSAALLAAFIHRQATIANPLMPLRLFRSRNVAGANVLQALIVAGMFGMFFLGALYLQRVLDYSAARGRSRLPADDRGDGDALARLLGKADHALRPAHDADPRRLPDRHRPAALRPHPGRRQLPDRPAAAVPADRRRHRHLLPGDHDPGDVGGDAEDSGLASGLVNTSMQVGGAIGLAVLATLSTERTQSLLDDGVSNASALTSGYHVAYLIGAGLAAISRGDRDLRPARPHPAAMAHGAEAPASDQEQGQEPGAAEPAYSEVG